MRRTIDAREPCELRCTLISPEGDQELSHCRHERGRDFALIGQQYGNRTRDIQIVSPMLYH